MAKFQIYVKQTPPNPLVVEAVSEEEAKEFAREDLHDWADQVELDADCDDREVESERSGTEE